LPGSPTDGDIYIVKPGAAANANEVAVRDNGAWVYFVASEGWLTWVKDNAEFARFDGTVWVVLETAGGATAGTAHRYWRINVESKHSGNAYTVINEVEFRGSAGGIDLTGAGTPFSSSDFNGSTGADKAFDNDPALAWASGSGLPQQIGYDFGAGNDVFIEELTMTTQTSALYVDQFPKDFSIQYSDDNIAWTTLKSFVSDAPVAQGDTLVYSTNAPTATLPRPYDIGIFVPGAIGNNDTVLTLPIGRDFKVLANLTDSVAALVAAPSGGSCAFSLQKNAVEFATLTFADAATTGVFSATTAGVDTEFLKTNTFSIVAPANTNGAAGLSAHIISKVEV
jgi:hypothetical protein